MNKGLTAILSKIAVLPILFLPSTAFAQAVEAYEELGEVAKEAGVSGDAIYLPALVGNLINAAITTLGIIFIILIVYAGFLYMTAQGEEDNVKKAKKLLTQSVIGLVIITSAYAISLFVFDLLATSASAGTQ